MRDAPGTGQAAILSNELRSVPPERVQTSKDESGVFRKSPPVSVFVFSDVRFLRESLAERFARDHTFMLADYGAELDEALAQIPLLEPDIVLIDAAFPDGLAAVRRIRDVAPRIRIVALALAETEESIIAWAEAGISGYIPRSAALSDLAGVLKTIIHGEQPCPAHVTASLLRRIGHSSAPVNGGSHPPGGMTLTRRELQIAQLIGHGLSNKEIARHLNIEPATTKSHVHNLLGKLNLQRRTQVAFWLHRHAGHEIGLSTQSLQN